MLVLVLAFVVGAGSLAERAAMSQLAPALVTCPRCAHAWSTALYSSLDADTIDAELDAVLDGSFERRSCPACAHEFSPEHSMLLVSHIRRLWIVMQPLADRPRYALMERGVELVLAEQFAAAARVVAERLRGTRGRLVFGHHQLTEAVRSAYAGLDASLLECAKLLTVRRQLLNLMPFGPFELCFEGFADDNSLFCGIHSLPTGERTGELEIPSEALAEATSRQAELRISFPELFDRPYISASRYLLAATV